MLFHRNITQIQSVKMNKPFQNYNGGKEGDGSYQKIISIMPPHDIYIEGCLGNGAIFRHKKPAAMANIGIDLDTSVISEWIKLQNLSITLINTDVISWLENFRVPATIFKKSGTRVLIYLDPPYPKDCRKSEKDLYNHEMNIQDHTKLLAVAVHTDANFVISSYANKLYDETLKAWNTFTFQAQTRSGTATEKVWYNYPPPIELHDYRYVGNDYRERERIKGIILRNASKFKRMPDLERNALIEHFKNEKIL